MTRTILLVTLLLGHSSFGQPTPHRGGLLTNETTKLPSDLAACGTIHYLNMNAQQGFMIGRTCSGEVKIYWSKAGGAFKVAASESEFGGYKILRLIADRWYFQELEMRADGLYFNLMHPNSPEQLSVFPGYGGSYRISNEGKLETVVAPKATIIFKDVNGGMRTAQVVTSSISFPKNGVGEHFFLRLSSNGVQISGIFSRVGTLWTLVLPFQVAPIPGLNAVYGLGQTFYSFGINEALDGTLSFMQGWTTQDGSYREWVVFNPKTKSLTPYYKYGEAIIGVSSSYFPTVMVNSDTRQRYWSLGSQYVVEAPNPGFKPSWKWILPTTPRGSMQGASDYIASYLLTTTNFQQIGGAMWDGKQLQTLILNGDIIGGIQISKIGPWMPVAGCSMWFTTSKPDDTVESLWKFEKPCITDAVADSAQGVLYGKNLSFSGYPPTILVDGVPVSRATITADRINIPSTGIPGGTRKVQVKTADGKMYSNEASVSVPITIPPPAITSVVTATFENRPIAPGALFTIEGNNISSVVSNLTNLFTPGITVPIVKPGEVPHLPTLLGGAQVLVNGREIHLNFSSCGLRSAKNPADCRINAQMPVDVTGSSVKLVIKRYTDINGQTLAATSQEFTVRIAPVSPVVFKGADELPILQIADRAYELVSNENSVKAGETLVAYATGFGLTSPVLEDGLAAGDVLAPVATETKAWLKFIRSGLEEFREWSIFPFASPQYAGVTQINFGALPEIFPDTGTEVNIVIKVGDEYIPDLKLHFKTVE